MFITLPRRYQRRIITVDNSSYRCLTNCCRFVFPTFLPHLPHYHHVVLVSWQQVLHSHCCRRCFHVSTRAASTFLYMHSCRGDLFLLYRCNRRFSSVSLGRPKTLRSICCFQAGWGSGCRRKAKVRCLTFSSTRQLYGASSFCLNF